ncbi:Serine/threonine-protein phosphatase PGAM5, mitochondrial [Orchesella cincta]|uniref:Serine/threonine-protein phosphatase PGAM5, mitochondrial n=1 Tax=Orchesella cincta TaxID=48709 RepID=A0A1D2NBK2_ORCCI|nr:Serine/threonine-protein phosphatase PGAM5, mitochondrial [Orchesella cincta]
MFRMKFLKYGKWIAGAAAAASVSIVVTHCSSASASPWSPSKPTNVPENFAKWDYNWDKREPYSLLKPPKRSKSSGDPGSGSSGDEDIMEKLEKKRAKAIRHIVLIRHGQYNMKGTNDKERYLTALGETQAELTGKRLKNSGITFQSLVCSNMTRAIQTAEIVLKELRQVDLSIEAHDPFLREGAPCLAEPPVGNWHPELHQYYEDGARIEAAFRKYFHRADPEQEKDSYELIVCHANVIRYFVCRALQFPGEAWLRISLNNCSLTIVSILPSGRVVLRALGDSGHMPYGTIST